ncbi:alcohol dehydrogenase, partial [Streptomyces sp. NPDC046924]
RDLLVFGRLSVAPLVTHRFRLDRAEEAYEVFAHGPETGALKVVLHREAPEPPR